MAEKNDANWKPEPLPPRPPRELPPPIVDVAEAVQAFADATGALRALAEMRDAIDEREREVPVDEKRLVYGELFRALGEVARTPLAVDERARMAALHDLVMALQSGGRLREAAREWNGIGGAVAARMRST